MDSNALLDPVPIRFTHRTKKRIHNVARRFGLKPSQIIRQAVENKLGEWERGDLTIQPKDPQT